MLRKLLAHPRTAGLDIDSPETTELRRQIIWTKPFLKKIYWEWYKFELEGLSTGPKLELGSGAGFLPKLDSSVIASDLFRVNELQVILNGQALPFASECLTAVLLTNVLHHVPEPARFLAEANRCLKSGGELRMIEPWLTPWSRFVYKNLHHEPVDENAHEWKIRGTGPLSGANGALPWIIFQRDLLKFEREFPHLKVAEVSPFMPFRYLISGGISLRSLMPSFSYSLWRFFETLLSPLNNFIGMFVKIRLIKQ